MINQEPVNTVVLTSSGLMTLWERDNMIEIYVALLAIFIGIFWLFVIKKICDK